MMATEVKFLSKSPAALDLHPVTLLEPHGHLSGEVPLAGLAEVVVAVSAAPGGATAAAEVATIAWALAEGYSI